MPTAIKIENCGCGRVIVIKRDGASLEYLYPGDESHLIHVREGSQITIEEMPLDKKPG